LPDVAQHKNPVWAELVQLLPVITLALPFIVNGEVELARAASGFLGGAALAVVVSALVRWRGHVQNPIAVGTAIWLTLGAVAFNVPVDPLATWLGDTQAFGLFVAVLCVGLGTTRFSPSGFIGWRSEDQQWIRRASLRLLVLSAAVVVWAWVFRANIRLGGGLPFIVLNVARRAMIVRRQGSEGLVRPLTPS
jgi:hypothetical protein